MTGGSRIVPIAAALLLMLAGAHAAGADDSDAAQQAKRRVQQAVAVIQQHGLAQACAMLDQPGAASDSGQGYVFVLDFSAVYKCYPLQPAAVGQNAYDLRDANGVLINQQMLQLVRSPSGQGWVHYVWLNPATRKLAPKVSFVERVPGQQLFVGSGYYQ